MREVYFPNSKDIYSIGFKTASIPLLAQGETRTPTWYRRHGDWFGWGCVALSAVAVLLTWQRRGGAG
jgi:apolipoprotein N-acyltransferase